MDDREIILCSCLRDEVESSLLNKRKTNYIIIFMYEYVHIENDPQGVIDMLREIVENDNIFINSVDVYIERKNLLEIVKEFKFPSWKIFDNKKYFMHIISREKKREKKRDNLIEKLEKDEKT